MNLQDLKKPFDPDKVSFRIGSRTHDKAKGIGLAYIDARDVMERLDEVCGPENWQALYPHANGKTSCKIGILCKWSGSDGGLHTEWVWKENGAGDTDIEGEKGAFSDAFKRAAVLWGIGRYLYDMPNVWVPLENEGKKFSAQAASMLKDALVKLSKGEKPTMPQPRTNVRMVSEINLLMTPAACDEWWGQNESEMAELPPEYKSEVVQQWENRKKQVEDGTAKVGVFKFASVEDSRFWVSEFKPKIDACLTPIALNNLIAANKPKLDAVTGSKNGKADKEELREYVAAKRASFNLQEAG